MFAGMAMMAQSVTTERLYLSGKGCDDMVEWDFMCTDGNNSGEWKRSECPHAGSFRASAHISTA